MQLVNQQMTVNFIPDGKSSGMSILNHLVDAQQTSKGMGGDTGGKQEAKAGSKKALAKQQKKDAKKDKKAANQAAGGGADGGKVQAANAKHAQAKAQAKPQGAAATQTARKYYSGPMADYLEN